MWSDSDTEHDCLGFKTYVDVLSEVCTIGELAPLPLGIFGSWGSGKTSLMRMLKARLDNQSNEGIKTLWFNAWRYEGREEAQSALIHSILAKVSEDKALLEDAKEVFTRLKKGASVLKLAKFITKTAFTLTPNLEGFIDCFKDQSQQVAETMEQFDDDFREFLDRMKVTHIVVFIDDLDRCSSQKVIETFETIKLFLNTPICTFVIGADAQKIEDAVGEIYQVDDRQRQKDYLEKIVQVPFTIPTQDLKDITCYVGMLVLWNQIEQQSIQELLDARDGFYRCEGEISDAISRWPSEHTVLFGERLNTVRNELNEVMPHVDVLARGLRGNPRQIKRFLNIVAMRRKLADANELPIEQGVLMTLAVLEYVWNDFFNSVVETVDPTTGHSELIAEVLRLAESSEEVSDSQIVLESMEKTGLVEFLVTATQRLREVDLNPYLFLAQTALSRGIRGGLEPIDEKAKTLARLIESDDPLRTKVAAKQVAALETSVASAVVRILLADLSKANMVVQTHILNGIGVICRGHKESYKTVLSSLGQFDHQQRDPVILAASTLLAAAESDGVEVTEEIKNRYASQSGVVAALSKSVRQGAPNKGKRK